MTTSCVFVSGNTKQNKTKQNKTNKKRKKENSPPIMQAFSRSNFYSYQRLFGGKGVFVGKYVHVSYCLIRISVLCVFFDLKIEWGVPVTPVLSWERLQLARN